MASFPTQLLPERGELGVNWAQAAVSQRSMSEQRFLQVLGAQSGLFLLRVVRLADPGSV